MPDPEGKMSSAQRERLGELCFRYLDGVLGDVELTELNTLLREFDEARALFAAYGQERFVLRDLLATAHEETDAASILGGLASLDSTLTGLPNAIDATDLPGDRTDIMSEVIDQALALRRQHELEDEANRQLAAQQAEQARLNRYRLRSSQTAASRREIVVPKTAVWIGLAAAIAFGLWLNNSGRDARPPAPQANHPAQSVPVSSIGVVVTQQSGLRWSYGGRAYDAKLGLSCDEGGYEIVSGVVELTYPDATTVVVLAPAQIEMHDADGITVLAGRVSCQVGERERDFSVHVPQGKFSVGDSKIAIKVDSGETQSYILEGAAIWRGQGQTMALGRDDYMSLSGKQKSPDIYRGTVLPGNMPADYESAERFAEMGARFYEGFDDTASLDAFSIGQGYIRSSSTPGRVRINDGRLELMPGVDNTVCCYLSSPAQVLPIEYYWVFDLAQAQGGDRTEHTRGLFFSLSTAPVQPGPLREDSEMRQDALGFRLRWNMNSEFGSVRIENDRIDSQPTTLQYDMRLNDEPIRFAISRIDATRFAFWVMFEAEEDWVLIGERDHVMLPEDAALSVGVEAYSSHGKDVFEIDSLRLVRDDD